MKTTRALGAALLATNWTVATAWGADCVGSDDMSALRTAAIQQELMVAALTCYDIARYNRFVLSRQAELIDSDNRLKAFFVLRNASSGEARYNTFKTELANASSLRSIRETASFCAHASAEFDLAARQMNLAAFVGMQPLALGAAYRPCQDNDSNVPVMADASAAPPVRRGIGQR